MSPAWVAMPNHAEAHRQWAAGSMVCAEIVSNSTVNMASAGVVASSSKDSEHVPRIPRASQPRWRSSCRFSASTTSNTWSLDAASSLRRAVTRIASAYAP